MSLRNIVIPGASNQDRMDHVLDYNKLIKDVCDGEYVLFVGPDIILNEEEGYNINNLIFNILKSNNLHLGCDSYNQYVDKDRDAYIQIQKAIDVLTPDEIDNALSPDLVNLLRTRCFRMVITTTFDPCLERIMEIVWGKGGFDVYSYNSQNATYNDLPVRMTGASEFFDIRPTLFYLFGNYGPHSPEVRTMIAKDIDRLRNEYSNDFRQILRRNDAIATKICLSERQQMEAIADWLNPQKFERLKKYIKSKKLMSIGVKHDDWAFRFMWYAIRGNDDIHTTGEKNITISDVSMNLDQRNSSDCKLNKYLNSIGVRVDTDPHTFIGSINRYFRLQISELEATATRNYNKWNTHAKCYFISYASEDYIYALHIYRHMTEAGLNVWLDYPQDDDKGLTAFDDYRKRIDAAITQCDYFVPILSTNTAKVLNDDIDKPEDKKRFFHSIEWKRAVLAQKKILPIAVGVSRDQSKELLRLDLVNAELPTDHSNMGFLYETPVSDIIKFLKQA